MENKTLKTTCIMCPLGCELEIFEQNKNIIVKGNTCERGKQYGESEITCPKRVLTTLVKTQTGVASVKTTKPIDKNKINQAMKEIEKLNLKTTKYGQILIKNIAGTDANLKVTR